ncbi:ribonuclease T2 [Sphingomonas sp. TZW2008]|uniref:ribonuclease T2 n=1 Tax=Sphingomonas sp. TZW2008 TaxID=1917973 RepID=UPI000A268CF2|nr:ribonuclease T2 [Sphingomonas sp. TZW2008]
MIRAAFAVSMLLPGVATAQALQCSVSPNTALSVRPDLPSEREPQRLLPIGHYTLAISWAPQYCRNKQDDPRASFQCGGDNRFGFVLHGLWPDGVGKEWPQYCKSTPLLSPATIRTNLCATPSAQLLQHEWAKHGTCMAGETPESYFGRSTGLYRKLRYPDMMGLSRRPLTAGRFAQAFARVNPGMRPDMMRVTTTREGWLDELWICMDKSFRYARCPAHQGGVAPSAKLRIWRGRR